MIQKFATKTDINGNSYGLNIDHTKRIFDRNFSSWHRDEYIRIGKRDRIRMIEDLKANLYKEVDSIK